jgi:hypothetical protein
LAFSAFPLFPPVSPFPLSSLPHSRFRFSLFRPPLRRTVAPADNNDAPASNIDAPASYNDAPGGDNDAPAGYIDAPAS